MKYIHRNHLKGFSIIEVMIGIFVFSLGLVAIYALLVSSLRVNEYNKNAVIASNLAREQVELVRNIRDTNYRELKGWDQYNIPDYPYVVTSSDTTNPLKVFVPENYYTLEAKQSASGVEVGHLSDLSGHSEGPSLIASMQNYRLCIDSSQRYTYDCSGGNVKTHFYRYVYIEQATDDGGNPIAGAMKLVSKVIWNKRGYHEYDITTLITDWRRI